MLGITAGIPKVMHYGLEFKVEGYTFDKHMHFDFDVLKCPPWVFNDKDATRKHGMFMHPPRISKLTTKVRS